MLKSTYLTHLIAEKATTTTANMQKLQQKECTNCRSRRRQQRTTTPQHHHHHHQSTRQSQERLKYRATTARLLPPLWPLLISTLLLTGQPPSALATRFNRQSQGHISYGAAGGANSLPSPHFPLDANTVYTSNAAAPGKHHANMNNDVYSVADSQAMTDDYMAQFGKPAASPPPPIIPPYLTHADNTLIVHHQPQLSSCQTVCACKWKGGKQTVECIDRQLIQIPENIDPSTQVLDMSGNKLQTLSNEKFIRANLLNLQKLYLRSCKIGEIEPETFKGLTNLVELDLSHNLLVVVPSLALSYISSLRELTLASNHIHKIESNSFASTPSLHKLDLSHCDIQTIAPLAFDGLEGLTLLRLNGNKLGVLQTRTIETLSKLHGIELHDNPWLCDCRMRDAKIWLTQKNIPYPVAPLCAGGPERVIDRTFSELQVEDFACRPEMLPISHYVEATMGENASVVCRAKAIPTAVINWYWNGRLLSNNSAFSSYQRVHIYENGHFEKHSRLVLTNAQETDSSEFYCVAENRAGTAEANFTLHVSMRAAGMASLGSGQIVGLSAALVVLIVCILLAVMFLLMRVKRQPYTESKTPNHMEVVTSVNHQNSITNKTQPITGNGSIGGVVIANGGIPNCIDTSGTLERKGSAAMSANEGGFANPVQKPPRLTDLPYSATGYDNNGSVLSTAPCYLSPTASAGNNPDLINDTKRFGSDEFADLKIPAILTANLGTELGNSSGEYSRAGGCDSLYPSGLWEHTPAGTSSADDLFMKRYTDKTPIIESNQLYDLHERTVDYFSKTFPRTHYNNLQLAGGCASTNGSTAGGVGGMMHNPSTSSAALLHNSNGGMGGTHSTASTTTTNLSGSSGAYVGSGYPNDYGLPLVPGAEHQHNHHLQMHPLQQLQQHMTAAAASQHGIGGNGSGSGNSSNHSSPHFSSRTLPRLHEHSGSGSSSSGAGLSSSRSSPTPATTAVAVTVTQNGTGQAHTSILPNGQPVNAKTLRVWQKGGVPVLPPVTALKRALTSNSRNSPDEGYQEGCGTDV
uniref:Trophoblast glycoprotein n=1 Tax=Zeugodacus cucurbitae TaxID=28588 RepID=A0A0A1XT83_ZEUCU